MFISQWDLHLDKLLREVLDSSPWGLWTKLADTEGESSEWQVVSEDSQWKAQELHERLEEMTD